MPSYLILDAYNVIGALDRYRDAETFDAARELLITDALKAAGWIGRAIIVVFDAHRAPTPAKKNPSPAAPSASSTAPRPVRRRRNRAPPLETGRFRHRLHGRLRPPTHSTRPRVHPRHPHEFANLLDELPAITRNPNVPRKSRVADRLSPETIRKLEEIRRRGT
ncbi:hypothetical protein GBA63_14295 [Rubrobacter tropicus]|uniref:NYN domain-containing protein n=1 Tax=Rubrobacter tropicus TaxID=2653851 RepID=A0A6G8QB35_9ACTN|nr:NYN domain-containing protein [Rubrobacter tropicus]QIN83671.1 hypothetical protein GBA63_14295 [Rubrobacter tropicus]